MQCILVSRLHTLRPISNSICAAQRCLFNDYKTCPNPKTYQVQNSGTPLLFYRPQSSLLKAWEVVRPYSTVSSDSTTPSTDIGYDQLTSMLRAQDIKLFDVRTKEEVTKTGMIPGAINIPLSEIKEAFSMDPDEFETKYGTPKPDSSDNNIIFHCLAGIRSRRAMLAVHDVGFPRVRHYIGGWEEYAEKMGM